jgi:hypothetical protein
MSPKLGRLAGVAAFAPEAMFAAEVIPLTDGACLAGVPVSDRVRPIVPEEIAGLLGIRVSPLNSEVDGPAAPTLDLGV